MGYESFRTFNKYDPNGDVVKQRFWVKAQGVSWSDIWNVRKDFGGDVFTGDYVHTVEAQYWNASPMATCSIWGLVQIPSLMPNFTTIPYLIAAGLDAHAVEFLHFLGTDLLSLRELDGGTVYQDNNTTDISSDTVYYLEMERDEDVGTYGALYCRIYSDEERTTLVDTLSLALHEKRDFEGVMALAAHDTSEYPDYYYSVQIDNLDLGLPTGNLITSLPTLSGEVAVVKTVDGSLNCSSPTLTGEAEREGGREADGSLSTSPAELSGTIKLTRDASGNLSTLRPTLSGSVGITGVSSPVGSLSTPLSTITSSVTVGWEVTGSLRTPQPTIQGTVSIEHTVSGSLTAARPTINASQLGDDTGMFWQVRRLRKLQYMRRLSNGTIARWARRRKR